jgi:MarR family 2-MHQ and catechol resistance regulon transcriptional repressor
MSNTATQQDSIESTYAKMRAAKALKSADHLALELSFNLVHTANLAQHRMAELAQTHGLTFTGFNVLGLLSYKRDEGMPLNEIGRLLLVSRANVTGLIDSLERKKLVERVDHATDRRVYLARITTQGEMLIQAYRPVHFNLISRMAENLSPAEKKTLIGLLQKWRISMAPERKD